MEISRITAFMIAVPFLFLDLLLSALFFVYTDHIDLNGGWIRIIFDIRTSQVDHCALVFVRVSILVGGLIGICWNPKSAVDRVKSAAFGVSCVCLILIEYSPFKLLLLAETTTNFWLPWFWSLFAWNISASIICSLIWHFVLGNVVLKNPTIVVIDANGDIQQLIDNEVVPDGRNHAVGELPEVKTTTTGDMSKKNEEEEESKKVRIKEATSLFWRLIKYTTPEWWWYTLGFVFLFGYSAARIFIPYFTGRVISDIVIERSYGRLLQSVGIMSGLAIASSICAGLRGGFFQYAIARMGIRIRSDLFRALVKQEIGFFDVVKTGDITSRLSADCQTVSDTVALNFNVFLRSGIMLIGTLAFMFTLCWQLTVMTFIAIPVIGVITKVYGKFYECLSKKAQDSLAKANEVAEEVLSSMRTVRSFANELGESKRYDDKLNEVMGVRTKQTYAYIGYMWINELFDLLLLSAVLWYGGHLVLTGHLKTENLIGYLLYQLQLGEALQAIGWVFTGLMQAVGAARKVFEWIDRKPEILNDGTEMLDQVRGQVEFKDVSFSYPSRPDVDVLKDISFRAKPGEVVALVGPSGGGKSSCIALLEHFYEPKAGVILLDGIPVQRIDHAIFHQKVSLVSQEPVLFGRSIGENISYGLAPDDWTLDDVVRASKLANAHQFVSALPASYDTDVGEKGVQLSGGQKQRIAIARALIRNPKVLLLDEATSALDAESEYLVKQALQQNLSGHTVLLIAHRLSTVEKADKIIVIDSGRVVQEGTHTQLLLEDGLYRNLVHRQLLGDRGHEATGSSPSVFESARTKTSKTESTPPISIVDEMRGSPPKSLSSSPV